MANEPKGAEAPKKAGDDPRTEAQKADAAAAGKTVKATPSGTAKLTAADVNVGAAAGENVLNPAVGPMPPSTKHDPVHNVSGPDLDEMEADDDEPAPKKSRNRKRKK